jgi:hypothetical protein
MFIASKCIGATSRRLDAIAVTRTHPRPENCTQVCFRANLFGTLITPVTGMPVLAMPVTLGKKSLTSCRHLLIILNRLAQALDLAPHARGHIPAKARHVATACGVERSLPRGNLGLHLG